MDTYISPAYKERKRYCFIHTCTEETVKDTSLGAAYNFKYYTSIADIDPALKIWENNPNLCLERPYFESVESNPPKDMRFLYAVVNDEKERPIGMVYFQIIYFEASGSLSTLKSATSSNFIECLANSIKKILIRKANFHILSVGNLMLTGNHTSFFQDSYSKEQKEQILDQAIVGAESYLAENRIESYVTIIKDLLPEERMSPQFIKKAGFTEFKVEPGMYLSIRENWTTLDKYFEDLYSKYRINSKRILSRTASYQWVNATKEYLHTHFSTLQSLYQQIVDNVDFNIIELDFQYIVGLKERLGDKFTVWILSDETGHPVGFCTALVNPDQLEAHYIGYDKKLNNDKNIYFALLIQLLRTAIEAKVTTLNYGRTAHEIKSSIGALPVELYCYMRHNKTVTNKFSKLILDFLAPPKALKLRDPLKAPVATTTAVNA